MKDCQHNCPLRVEKASTYEMHPSCIPCGDYRQASRSEDLRKVSWDTTAFTVVAASALSVILAGQTLIF